MADETNTDVTAETATMAPTVATPIARKTRGPNRKKPASEATAATTTAEVPAKKTRAKRGEKAAAAKLLKAAKAERAIIAPVVATTVSDEFSDLLMLEEENRILRKELGDKLRAENADLKKKLGKG